MNKKLALTIVLCGLFLSFVSVGIIKANVRLPYEGSLAYESPSSNTTVYDLVATIGFEMQVAVGQAKIACAHTDLRGNIWSTY